MKKVILSLFIITTMFSTIVFAAYPEDAEDNQEGLEVFSEEESSNDEIEPVESMEGESEDFGYNDDYNEVDVEDTVIEDDKFVCDDEVEIKEVIDGNLFVMAKTLKISDASILGNVYAMAEKIEIEDSTIASSMFLMGKDIKISAYANDVYIIGENVEFTESSNIWRDVKIGAGKLNINGSIGRNIFANVGNMTIGDNAIIDGNLEYSSENKATIAEGAQIKNTSFSPAEIKEINTKDIIKASIFGKVWSLLSFVFKVLVISLILIFLSKRFSTVKRDEKPINDYLKSFGKGAAVLVVIPIIALCFFISVLGIGIGCVLTLLYIVLLYISTSVFVVDCAYRIAEKKKIESKGKLIGISILVAIIIWIIELIPAIGGLIEFILLLVGLGILFDLFLAKIKKSGEI